MIVSEKTCIVCSVPVPCSIIAINAIRIVTNLPAEGAKVWSVPFCTQQSVNFTEILKDTDHLPRIRKQNLTMNSSLTVYRVRKNLPIDHPVGHVEDVPGQAPRRLFIRMKNGLPSYAEAHQYHQHDHDKVHHVNHLKEKEANTLELSLLFLYLQRFCMTSLCLPFSLSSSHMVPGTC